MTDKSGGAQSAVFWWLGWITLTILSFFIACYFWTGFIAKHVGTMDEPGVALLWVAAVFGSWMVLLVPLIVLMYNKVDRSYEDARIAREASEYKKAREYFKVRSISIPEENRQLSKALRDKLKKAPTAINRGHLVTVVTKAGQKIDNVFILDRQQVLGIYDATTMPFKVEEVADLIPANLDQIPRFESRRWLRLDGVGEAI